MRSNLLYRKTKRYS